MYVSWEDFATLTLGYVIVHPDEKGDDNTEPRQPDFTEEQYMRLAPMADAIIDDWTLGRVGRAVKNGEELPLQVLHLYVTIIESLPAIMDNTKMGKGGLVTSFSNGIDSYSFDVTVGIAEQLHKQIGWMIDMLPVEWISGDVAFEGGNKYAC